MGTNDVAAAESTRILIMLRIAADSRRKPPRPLPCRRVQAIYRLVAVASTERPRPNSFVVSFQVVFGTQNRAQTRLSLVMAAHSSRIVYSKQVRTRVYSAFPPSKYAPRAEIQV